jgi:hypothetical protein
MTMNFSGPIFQVLGTDCHDRVHWPRAFLSVPQQWCQQQRQQVEQEAVTKNHLSTFTHVGTSSGDVPMIPPSSGSWLWFSESCTGLGYCKDERARSQQLVLVPAAHKEELYGAVPY